MLPSNINRQKSNNATNFSKSAAQKKMKTTIGNFKSSSTGQDPSSTILSQRKSLLLVVKITSPFTVWFRIKTKLHHGCRWPTCWLTFLSFGLTITSTQKSQAPSNTVTGRHLISNLLKNK